MFGNRRPARVSTWLIFALFFFVVPPTLLAVVGVMYRAVSAQTPHAGDNFQNVVQNKPDTPTNRSIGTRIGYPILPERASTDRAVGQPMALQSPSRYTTAGDRFVVVEHVIRPEVQSLVNELRSLDPDGTEHAKRMGKLRDLLDQEFQQMHERQGREIAETQRRLESLRERHELRAEKRETIITRRIDQLLGNPDPLQWQTRLRRYPDPNVNGGVLGQSAQMNSGQRSVFSTARNNTPRNGGTIRVWPTDDAPSIYGSTGSGRPAGSRQTFGSDQSAGTRPAARPIRNERNRPSAFPSQPPPTTSGLSPRAVERPTGAGFPKSTLSNVFDLAGEMAQAHSDFESARAALSRWREIAFPNSSTQAKLTEAQLALAQAERDIRLHRQEFSAMRDKLSRDIEFASEALESASSSLRRAETKFEQGVVSRDKLEDAKLEHSRAMKLRAEARATLKQLDEAFEELEETDPTAGSDRRHAKNRPDAATPGRPTDDSARGRTDDVDFVDEDPNEDPDFSDDTTSPSAATDDPL